METRASNSMYNVNITMLLFIRYSTHAILLCTVFAAYTL